MNKNILKRFFALFFTMTNRVSIVFEIVDAMLTSKKAEQCSFVERCQRHHSCIKKKASIPKKRESHALERLK